MTILQDLVKMFVKSFFVALLKKFGLNFEKAAKILKSVKN